MNEERDREEFLPGTPPLVRGERRDEFERMRGEVQLPGTRVLAVPPPEPPAPVGIAPPDPRNVVSNFDTRPIGAYDFAHTEVVNMHNEDEADVVSGVFSFPVPDGYTAALRRVRIEFTPPGAMRIGNPAAVDDPTTFLTMSLTRDGGIIPNNSVRFFGILDQYEWDTHQVFGFWETMGLLISVEGAFAIPADFNIGMFVAVTFFGVLIPTKSRPPEVEIASDPVVIRDYENLINEPPKVGAAGR